MTLTKESQYAILFCMYLCNAGRATAATAAKNMGLSKSFLDQVARRLRLAGMIQSTRGPGGGFSLVSKEITVYDVVTALKTNIELITQEDEKRHRFGSPEQRAFARFSHWYAHDVYSFWDVKLTEILRFLALEEKLELDLLNEESTMQ